MTTTKQFDLLNRLSSISSAIGSSAIGYSYAYNSANQRVRSALADRCYWLYEYDSLGQVRSGRKYWPDQTPVAGQQFEYAFDDIGNRTQTKAGGDENGANLRSAGYAANSLNQYTNRDVPGAVDIFGVSFATNTVTVSGLAAYRKAEYFRKEVAVNNSNGPIWTNITVAATGQTSVSGNAFVPRTPELFYYDADGNLTNDGRWTYTWDAENRLKSLAPRTNVGPQISLKFEYDWQGRRIRKQVWSNTTWNGTPTNDVTFVYDGWNLQAQLNATNKALLKSFVWGPDLSGSLQGAGGVGGLLFVRDLSSAIGYCAPAYDGNGNVAGLASISGGTNCASYKYGPFGEVIRATGPARGTNPIRFSTKYEDDETDLLYYGRRYYNASTGRWLSRDPIDEQGGLNVYAFVGNNPTCRADSIGLDALQYSSDGETFVDPPWWKWPWRKVDGGADESGVQASPNAWFWQWRTEIYCPGGLCNSGILGDDNSSFVTAEVKNTSKCPLRVTCHCSISFSVSNWGRTRGTGILVKGKVLDESVYQLAAMDPTPDAGGWYHGRLWVFESQTLTFPLGPGAKRELYRVQDQVSVHPDEPGAGFQESGLGLCDCQAQ